MKISSQLHISTYSMFRKYLDMTYGGTGEVLSLSMGYPEPGEFPLPKSVLSGLNVEENGVEKFRPGYGWNAGSYELRKDIVELENMLHGTSYSVSNICMVAGATYAFNRILEHLFWDYQENFLSDFLIVAPTYYRMLNRVDKFANVISVVGQEKNNFQITADELLAAISNKTKAIFLANPTNPTYLYYTPEFFEKIMPILERKGIYLIVDESGDAFNLGVGQDRLKRFSPIIGHKNIIRIVTASKKYLMAEYRIGYVIASEEIMGNKSHGFIKLIGDDIGNAPLATNEALRKIACLEKEIIQGKITDEVRKYDEVMNQNNYKMMRLKEIALEILRKSECIQNIIQPQSNFNITFKIRTSQFRSDMDFFEELLKQTGVSILPCSGLGLSEKDFYFRLTYGIKEQELRRGLAILIDFCEKNC